jgi:hypothetical protein
MQQSTGQGRVAQPFGFRPPDQYVRLSRIRLLPRVTRVAATEQVGDGEPAPKRRWTERGVRGLAGGLSSTTADLPPLPLLPPVSLLPPTPYPLLPLQPYSPRMCPTYRARRPAVVGC